mgnify:CR=1 FL=1
MANGLFIFAYSAKRILFKDQEEIILKNFTSKNVLEMFAESIILNPFEILLKEDGTSVRLGTILENEKQIFLLISGNTCNSCIYHCLEELYTYAQEIGYSNIIVLGLFDNKRNFFLLARKYPYNYYLLERTSTLSELALKSQNPLFFSIEYPYRVRFAFSPVSTYKNLTVSYLKMFLRLSNYPSSE